MSPEHRQMYESYKSSAVGKPMSEGEWMIARGAAERNISEIKRMIGDLILLEAVSYDELNDLKSKLESTIPKVDEAIAAKEVPK